MAVGAFSGADGAESLCDFCETYYRRREQFEIKRRTEDCANWVRFERTFDFKSCVYDDKGNRLNICYDYGFALNYCPVCGHKLK